MKKSIIIIFLFAYTVVQAQVTFVKQVEKAFNVTKFHKQDLVSFDIDLSFGGKSSLKGQVISATNSGKIKLIKEDGTIIVFDGEKVWITPEKNNNAKARFDIFTWQYFFMAPFKMSDKGTIWAELGQQNYTAGQKLDASKLTFDSGTGDASGDYYVVYKDAQNLVKAMGYIVTFGGKSLADAEKNAHAIAYSDYAKVDGVFFAKKWAYHNWSQAKGITEQIGEANISNIKFLNSNEVDFSKPEAAVEVKLK